MRYAILDGQIIANVIECDEQNASLFDAHYLGESTLGIGDTYPSTDIPIPREPTELELTQQDITDLQLSDIERGQEITEIQLQLLGAAE
jgi:hypothetical protein